VSTNNDRRTGKQKTKEERFDAGELREHEFYKIKGFMTVVDEAAIEDLIALVNSSDKKFRHVMMAELAVQFLMDEK